MQQVLTEFRSQRERKKRQINPEYKDYFLVLERKEFLRIDWPALVKSCTQIHLEKNPEQTIKSFTPKSFKKPK